MAVLVTWRNGPAHNSQRPARQRAFRALLPYWRAAAMEGDPPPVEERRRLREELSEFVESCWRTLEEVTTSLGWTLDRLVPGEEEAAAEVRRGVLSGALRRAEGSRLPGCGGLGTGRQRRRTPRPRDVRTLFPGRRAPAEPRPREAEKSLWVRSGWWGRSGVGKQGGGYGGGPLCRLSQASQLHQMGCRESLRVQFPLLCRTMVHV